MTSIGQDLRFGFRMLLKSPGMTLAAILAFGVGIGANAAMFSVSNVYLRNPISFPEVNRIVMVLGQAPGQTEGWSEISPADFLDWRAQNRSFESLAAYEWETVNLTGVGQPVKIQGFCVSANFFDVLRAAPILGRGFAAGEDAPGGEHVAVLSAGLWRRQFASDPNVVGKTIRLDGLPTQIVGVMNDKVRFPQGVEIWMPLALSSEAKPLRTVHYLSPIGRLRPDVTLEQARAEMTAIEARLQSAFPETEKGWRVLCLTLGDFVAGPGKSYTTLCLGAVGFLLLIACTNVANLLLARSAARQAEFALRFALGASRIRLIQQVLAESVVLALGGSLAGLLLGSWWISLIRGAMPPEVERFIPAWDQIRLDPGTFLYTLGVALMAGILAGLFPALYGSAVNLNDSLKEGTPGAGTSPARLRLRSAMVVGQVALSLVLLVGAALMAKGVQTLFRLNFKFNPESVLTFRIALPDYKYATRQQRFAFFARLNETLDHTAGVESSATTTQVPFAGGYTSSFRVEGQPRQPGEFQSADCVNISPAYFKLLGVPVREGREFSDTDSAEAAPVAMVSENFAKRFWPEGNALGHRIKPDDEKAKEPWATIVGVVPEVTYDPWTHEPLPAIYFPLGQRPVPNAYVAVRTNSDPQAFLARIRTAVASIDSDQPVYDVFSLDHVISNQILGLSYVAVLMGAIGLMALGLSTVGVSGLMAYSVTERVHEIGVRMALGAGPKDVLRLFIRHGLSLMIVGLGIGLPLAFALARLLSSLFFGVESSDFLSFFGGALLLAAAILLACYLPARQATRVDPIVALRYE
jgi:putative ABC transport system permease protein